MSGSRHPPLVAAAARAAVAEVVYDAGPRPQVAALVPLVADGGLVFALPYAQAALAEGLAGAAAVGLALADPRLAGRGFTPLAATGRCSLDTDPDGARFEAELLTMELAKHPPSRTLADSRLLRREHWWFLPRLLLRFLPADSWPVAAKPPGGGVCFWPQSVGWGGATVAASDWQADEVTVRGEGLPTRADPALLLRHDFSPDRERSATLALTGTLTGDRLRVRGRQGRADLPGPPRLLERLRAQRALRRGCVAGLRSATGSRSCGGGGR